MADVFVIGIFVVLVIIAVLIVTTAYNRRVTAKIPWMLEEHLDEHDRMVVYCVRPGEPRQPIGAVRWLDPDFESRIEEIRAEARMRLVALNNDRTLSRG